MTTILEGKKVLRREHVLAAMNASGFDRIESCCPEEMRKFCRNDQYRGNLEAFAAALLDELDKEP